MVLAPTAALILTYDDCSILAFEFIYIVEPREGEATNIGITKIIVNIKATAGFANVITSTRLVWIIFLFLRKIPIVIIQNRNIVAFTNFILNVF